MRFRESGLVLRGRLRRDQGIFPSEPILGVAFECAWHLVSKVPKDLFATHVQILFRRRSDETYSTNT
jgi:hypothetical protein